MSHALNEGFSACSERFDENPVPRVVAGGSFVTVVSCSINAPTPSSEIVASPVSELKYAEYTCASLTTVLESLARRNQDLVRAQEKRIQSSEVQGTILGVGQGDGAEASELSKVRGEQAAASKVFNAKRCEYNR